MDELAKIFRMVVMGEDSVKGIAVTMENIADAATIAKEALEAFCDLLQEEGKGCFKDPEKIAKSFNVQLP